MEPDQIKAWAEFAQAINGLRTVVLVVVSIVLVGGFGGLFWYRVAAAKEKRRLEEAKNKRAGDYRSSIESLASSIKQMSEGQQSWNRRQHDSLADLNQTLVDVGLIVRKLGNKIEGKLGRDDTVRLIHYTMLRVAYREVCRIVETSMVENDYEHRKEFVSRKVRTKMGDAIADARANLIAYPLAFDPSVYFPVSNGTEGERFTLVDELWRRVEPQFDHARGTLANRQEEVFLLIENTIRDHLDRCWAILAGQTNGHSSGKGYDKSAFRTPLPSPGRLDSETDKMPAMPAPGVETARLIDQSRHHAPGR